MMGSKKLALEGGFHAAGFLEVVEVLEEEEPRGLLGVVELRVAAGLLEKDVVDILKGLFEHDGTIKVRNRISEA